ncbi:hypothetical protein BWI96_17865 [Siphonobacter sp. SORGH_AS_0500]|nr:hypothetical protein BWI96_17865 [Siphonobacter sp. SORGH_AS_0500]
MIVTSLIWRKSANEMNAATSTRCDYKIHAFRIDFAIHQINKKFVLIYYYIFVYFTVIKAIPF